MAYVPMHEDTLSLIEKIPALLEEAFLHREKGFKISGPVIKPTAVDNVRP